SDQSGKPQSVDVPAEVREAAQSWRDKLVEMVAETNESLLEEFFEKGTLEPEQLAKGLRQAILAARIFPVVPASSLRNVGLHSLLDVVIDLLPSPMDRGEVTGTDPATGKETTRQPSNDAPFSALVFKTMV